MTDIQAETAILRIECGKELAMELRPIFPDVFEQQGGLQNLGAGYQRFPDSEAPLQEAIVMTAVMTWIEARMANHLNGLEDLHQVEELVEAKLGYLADESIGAACAEVPERPMQRDAASRLMKLFRNGVKKRSRNAVEVFRLQADFDVD
jgi:hypothetical protein